LLTKSLLVLRRYSQISWRYSARGIDLNNWEGLNQYVTDGDLAIDNNASEREMKYVAMGKKA